jgi:biotin transport system substrate-specific component
MTGLPEVLDRAVPVTDWRGVRDCAGHVVSGVLYRLREGSPEREPCCQRRGERAAGAVGVRARDALGHHFREIPPVEKEIHQPRAFEVSALDHHRAAAGVRDLPRRLAGILDGSHGTAGKLRRLLAIGRDDRGHRQQDSFQCRQGRGIKEMVPALGHHYGIDDHVRQAPAYEGGGDGLYDRGVREHPRLYRVEPDVGGHGVNLRGDHSRRQHVDGRDLHRILRGDCGDGARAEHAVRGKCLQVGLDAGPPARVAARNCQHVVHTLESPLMRRNAGMVPLNPTPTFLAAAVGATDDRALGIAVRVAAVLFMTVLTAAAAQMSLPLPFTPVPFTFQPVVVLLGGALLGPRLGACSQLLYLGAGVAGLPVFAASLTLPQGAARLLGPTGGYLMAYPAAAFLTGWLASRGFDRRYATAVIAMLAGLAVVFTGGVLWLAQYTGGLGPALGKGLLPFVLADLLKVCIAAAVLPALWLLTGLGSRTA